MGSASLPRLQFVSKHELSPNAGCAICLDEVPEFAVRLICGHAIGVNCINQWLTASKHDLCPRCNYPLLEKDDDESVDSAFGPGSRSPSVTRVDARSTAFRQLDADRIVLSGRPSGAPMRPALNAPQGSGHVYLPYRPPHYTPPSSNSNQAPSQSPRHALPGPSYSQPPYQPSLTLETPNDVARATNKTPNIPFIPSEYGLPPRTVRPSLATLSCASRNNGINLPISLLTGPGRSIHTMNQSDLFTTSTDYGQANLVASSEAARPAYTPSNYVPYRPGSYSSVESSDV